MALEDLAIQDMDIRASNESLISCTYFLRQIFRNTLHVTLHLILFSCKICHFNVIFSLPIMRTILFHCYCTDDFELFY